MKALPRDPSLIWFANGVDVLDRPGFVISKEANLAACKALISHLKNQSIPATYTLVLVKVLALALGKMPAWKTLCNDSESLETPMLKLGISIDYPFPVTPLAVLESPETKSIADIHRELTLAKSEGIARHEKLIEFTRSWGKYIPFKALRRFLIGKALNDLPGRFEAAGNFQISCLPDVDMFFPLMFSTSAILTMGQVRDKLIVNGEGGTEQVPAAMVSLVVNHKFWNGRAASDLLNTIVSLLEEIPFNS
jgi:pyruvate/2-oxoglutarate dehydrogenase complex dihydrolipoamide acyltransferase (E2) component